MLQICALYHPGHQMHRIQAKKSLESGQPVIPVKIVAVQSEGLIDLMSAGAEFRLWHHDPERLVHTFDIGDSAEWRPKHRVLRTVWAGPINMAAPDQAASCQPPGYRPPGAGRHQR